MYLRETRRRNVDGSEVAYLALAHNERDPATGVSKARVIHNFGRADLVDRDGLARLVRSVSRFLDPADAVAASVDGEVAISDSRPMGAAWVADQLWQRLGIGKAIIEVVSARAGPGRRVDAALVERVVFAMVANRLSPTPLSKLAGCAWVAHRVFIDGLAQVSDDACYRAMDTFLATLEQLRQAVFFAVANLLNLQVDILFFDTSSTYWQTDVRHLLRHHHPHPRHGHPQRSDDHGPADRLHRRHGPALQRLALHRTSPLRLTRALSGDTLAPPRSAAAIPHAHPPEKPGKTDNTGSDQRRRAGAVDPERPPRSLNDRQTAMLSVSGSGGATYSPLLAYLRTSPPRDRR